MPRQVPGHGLPSAGSSFYIKYPEQTTDEIIRWIVDADTPAFTGERRNSEYGNLKPGRPGGGTPPVKPSFFGLDFTRKRDQRAKPIY